jgi:hypothetical protein
MSEWAIASKVILSVVAQGFDLRDAGYAIARAAAKGTIHARYVSSQEKVWSAVWYSTDVLAFARTGTLLVDRDYSASVRIPSRSPGAGGIHAEVEFHGKRLPEFFTSLVLPRKPQIPVEDDREASSKASGGRPAAEWWDDLWLALFNRLYADGWRPKTQAAVVGAMQDWLIANGKSAAESTLKSRARKLFMALELGEGS